MGYNYQDAPRESQQEYFGRVHTDNTETLQNALKRIEELEAYIEKMKCCGNCKGVCISDDVAHCCKNNNYKLWEIKEK
jgi:hypothetical protein